MIAIRCDRCGKIEEKGHNTAADSVPKPWTRITVRGYRPTGTGPGRGYASADATIDLCLYCAVVVAYATQDALEMSEKDAEAWRRDHQDP